MGAPTLTTGGPPPVTVPKASPVKAFAALVLGLYLYVLGRWVSSPAFTPSPVGADPIPRWLFVLTRFTEAFCGALILWFLWALLIKPWIREKKMPWDGMLMLALFTMWVQDPMVNYFNFTFMYNAYFLNRGSWSSFLPGWQSPRGSNLPEPIFLMGGIYLWWTTINVIAFSWSLGRAKTFIRFLSLVGFCNLSYFVVYFLPYNWMAMQADTFPPYPSYMRYEICGKGTPYACPSREVPVPSRGTVAPVGPDDPRLSPTARQN